MIKKIPDNVVFNNVENKYDAFKKPYPTSLSSPNFDKISIRKISNSAVELLKTKFNEINSEYKVFLDQVKYNELVYNSKYNFKPLPGREYYLYKKSEYNFLSLIKPSEWNQTFIGSFTLMSNDLWKRNIL